MKELQGKVTVITGGSRGIGKACCEAFASEGATVVFTYNKSKKDAEILRQVLLKRTKHVVAVKADVADIEQCRILIDKALAKFKKIDIVVNNAGINKDRPLFMMADDEWKSVIDTNLGGVYNMSRSVITTLLKQKEGCIINMSSVSGLSGLPGQTNYSASKAGIVGFTKALAKEVAAYGIRVNAVCPGFIDTDMVGGIREDVKMALIGSIPMKRMGSAAEVASLCLYLATDKAKYITGETIKIDGGLAI